ncbi:TldD/PmbA family protein [Candidatus Aerophobetes bacterium]|nr:TldD/PmbA family protein [Candidatus Aerophobetes bacterium]
MEKIMEMALREAEGVEIYQEEFENTTVSFESNRLKSVESSFGQGIGLRVIKNGKIGFSSATNNEDLDLLVKSALEAASFGQHAYFKFPGKSHIPEVKCFDPSILSIPVEEMVEEGEEAIKLILKEFPDFRCEAELNKTITKTSIINSSGLRFSYNKSLYSFSVYTFLAQEGNFLGVEEEESSCQHRKWSNLLAKRVIDKIKFAQKKADIQTGTYPVIFTPKAMPLLLSSLKMGINGKLVQKKISPLSSKLGQKITSQLISIFDDATFPYASASSPIDGEGIPSRKNPIVEKGILNSFIYDLQTAGLMKTETTANAARDYDTPPSPSTTNLIIEPGDVSLEEMIKDTEEGLIVDQVIGAGQSNMLMGEFSVNLDLGFKIKKGKVVGRVKDIMATGNVYDLLNSTIAVGREAKFVESIYTPPIYFAKINISG